MGPDDAIKSALDGTLTEAQAAALPALGPAAVSTPSGMKPVYEKPATDKRRRKSPEARPGHNGSRPKAPITIDQPFDCAQGLAGRRQLADRGVPPWDQADDTSTELRAVERCQRRVARAQRGHVGLALRSFVIVERYCFRTGVHWLTAKREILHEAIRVCRTTPYDRKLGTA